MRLPLLFCCSAVLFFSYTTEAQDTTAVVDRIVDFPSRFIEKIQKKSSDIEDKLISKTEKYLKRLARQEQKIYKELKKVDSAAAENLFAKSQEQYASMLKKLKDPNSTLTNAAGGEYRPYIDSLKSSLLFLNENQDLLSSSKEMKDKINQSLGQFNELQAKLKQSDEIKRFINERKEQIKKTISRYTKLPSGIQNEYERLSKDIYYYTQQVKEYRELLNDPDKMALKAISLLNRIPAFANFMQKHSELAALFPVSNDISAASLLNGLQTRSQVQQLLMNQLGTAPTSLDAFRQNLQGAQTELSQIKQKINQLGEGGGDLDMPDFKPNNEKSKTFWKRLEFGTNLQSTRSNYFYPTSTDLGLSVGYKISGTSILGLGMAYKIGWGKDINHVVVTHEGVGFRSFFETKIKGSFFATAGFEYNYQQPFNSLDQLKYVDNWQQSGLAGITKIISLKSKVFKKTNVQLLWDFLSYQQNPPTQPIKFRLGYNF